MSQGDAAFLTLVIVTAIAVRTIWRVTQVHGFIFGMVKLGLFYNLRHSIKILSGEIPPADTWLLPAMPSFEKLLFSFRPLRMEIWFNKEIIDKLKS